ncbi:MAG TPA: hypothetical protein VLS94_05525, partial [Fusibacter sp.]|nr:hypothetical protein [Fusibacter sp.]
MNEEKEKHGGKLPYGVLKSIVDNVTSNGVAATRHMISGRAKRAMKPVPSTVVPVQSIVVPTGGSSAQSELSPNNSSFSSAGGNATAIINTANISFTANITITNGNSRGRPKGSTIKAKNDNDSLTKQVMNEVTVEYSSALDAHQANSNQKRLPIGFLEELIKKKRDELGLPDKEKISMKTIRNRREKNRKSLTPKHPGTESPMAAIEQLILPTIIQMGKIRQPLRPPEVIELANSMIHGTYHQQKLIEWKKMHVPHQTGEDLGKVGEGWYTGFMHRNRGVVTSSAGRRFACDRSEWMHPSYLDHMYNSIYDIFVEARVATRLDAAVAYNMNGDVVPIGSNEQYGLPSNIK